MTTRRESFDAGDVLIVGGGATGVLTALCAARRGLRCTLVEREKLGAGQSGHSHGYLHDGYAYLDADVQMVIDLRRGSKRWRDLLKARNIPAATEASKIVFADPLNALAATRQWQAMGLPVEEDAPYRMIRPDAAHAAYRTGERSYDFEPVFRALRSDLEDAAVTTVYADVERVVTEHDNVRYVDACLQSEDGPARVRLYAKSYVLAEGTTNEQLIANATKLRGRAISRVSHMLAMSSPDLPRMSVIFPEKEMYGLFIVSRAEGGRTVWLVSTFHSYARGAVEPLSKRCWLQGTIPVLLRAFELDFESPDFQLGLYSAPKMELRPRPGELSGHAAEDHLLLNLQVAAPTKLTLAPVLAEQVAGAVEERCTGVVPSAAQPIRDIQTPIPEGKERWKLEGLFPVRELLSNYGLTLDSVRQGAWA